jgi:hypothetical protein
MPISAARLRRAGCAFTVVGTNWADIAHFPSQLNAAIRIFEEACGATSDC